MRALAALLALGLLVTPAWAQEAHRLSRPFAHAGSNSYDRCGAICGTGTAQFRHWDRARADRIFESYHIARKDQIQYTLDHLCRCEIGGADTIENIWPEPRRSLAGEWDDEAKDQLERRLAVLVCDRSLPVTEAQRAIAEDWTAAYARFFPTGHTYVRSAIDAKEPR